MSSRTPALVLLLVPSLPAAAVALQDPPPEAAPEVDPVGAELDQEDPVGEPSVPEKIDTAGAQDRPPLDLSVEDALRLALSNNIDLRLDEIATDVAAFDARGSWGAFEWVFDGSVSYIDGTNEGSSALSGGSVVDTTNKSANLSLSKALTTGGSLSARYDTSDDETTSTFSNAPELTTDVLTLSFVQPLRRGFGSEYATSNQLQAELEWQLQRELQRDGRQSMEFAVYNAYWDLVDAIQQRGVAQSALELALEQLTQNRRRLDAGVGTEVDVLQAQADVALRIEALLRAQTDVETRMDGLKMLLFSSKDEDLWELEIIPITPLPEEPTAEGVPEWTDALMTALDMRSELRQQRTTIEIARVQHKRTLSERLSGVELRLTARSGSVDEDRGDSFSDTVSWEFPTYTAVLAYNMPIGNKTADYAERAARAGVRSALLTYDGLELQVLTEVRQAVRDVVYQVEAVRAAVESLRLERRQYEAEEARFTEGLSTNFEVLEFQQSFIEAMVRERQSRVNYAKSLVALRNAQGILTEAPSPR